MHPISPLGAYDGKIIETAGSVELGDPEELVCRDREGSETIARDPENDKPPCPTHGFSPEKSPCRDGTLIKMM